MASYNFTGWQTPYGWIVNGVSGSADLAEGLTLTFEGPGDGGATSLVKVDGLPWGEKCVHHRTTDSVTFQVGGDQYEVSRNGSAVPPTLSGALAGPQIQSGGSWTAEEGSAGVNHPHVPPKLDPVLPVL